MSERHFSGAYWFLSVFHTDLVHWWSRERYRWSYKRTVAPTESWCNAPLWRTAEQACVSPWLWSSSGKHRWRINSFVSSLLKAGGWTINIPSNGHVVSYGSVLCRTLAMWFCVGQYASLVFRHELWCVIATLQYEVQLRNEITVYSYRCLEELMSCPLFNYYRMEISRKLARWLACHWSKGVLDTLSLHLLYMSTYVVGILAVFHQQWMRFPTPSWKPH